MRDVIIILFRLIRPTIILGIVILFFLGAGIAAYLGNVINWLVLILGLGWMILIQASTHYFYFYYDIIGQTFIRNDPSQPQQAGKIVLSRSEDVLWVGTAPWADVLGARLAELPVVWIKRTMRNSVGPLEIAPWEPLPDYEFDDLWGLLSLLKEGRQR